MNRSSSLAQLAPTELLGLQRAGTFLSQRQRPRPRVLHHAHSPPITIPRPQHLFEGAGAHFMYQPSDESFQPLTPTTTRHIQDEESTASSSFLAAIRRGLHDNSPSWNDNGWFIGDGSDEEDDDDDFYSSMMDPYGGAADMTTYGGSCAPAGAFARFSDVQAPATDLVDLDLACATTNSLDQEGSLIFAMEV